MAHILVVDDEVKMRHLLALLLERNGHAAEQASDGLEAYAKMKETPYDMVISDIKMPRMSGVELLQKAKTEDLPCPFVFITAFATVDSAVETMRLGASDYITKPFDEDRILLTVERTLNFSRVMKENRELKQELCLAAGSGDIVYRSRAMQSVIDLTDKVARSESVVMIHGESGTGKELLARHIHHQSGRKSGRFVPINCAAIPAQLVESELYGYEKGAFTGADKRTKGKFEFASEGTLLMDEIGDLPLEAQAKLLRTLQEKTIRRVGGNEEIPVNARFICATNQDLLKLVRDGRFRQDLFYRINVVPIELPPLRERVEDIAPLCRHFLTLLGKGRTMELSDGAGRLLATYRWPGNVRELANAMERAMIIGSDQGIITTATLSFLNDMRNTDPNSRAFQLPPGGIRLEEFNKEMVNQALRLTGNNQTQAARLLGLTRAKFRVLLKNLE